MSDLIERLEAEAKAMRAAPSGERVGDTFHAQNWADKPHRVVYDACRLLDEARAELSRLRSLNGWRWVPEEPTEAMVFAAMFAAETYVERGIADQPVAAVVYRAMLKAAPALPVIGEGEKP